MQGTSKPDWRSGCEGHPLLGNILESSTAYSCAASNGTTDPSYTCSLIIDLKTRHATVLQTRAGKRLLPRVAALRQCWRQSKGLPIACSINGDNKKPEAKHVTAPSWAHPKQGCRYGPREPKGERNSCQTLNPENPPEINENLAAGYVEGSSRNKLRPRITID